MRIEVMPVPVEQKPVIRNMLQLYIYDFSEFAGFDLGEHGIYEYRWLDHYWTDEGRYPFLVRVDGQLAGFALVRVVEGTDGPETHMAEFFVMRKYRRGGIGATVARDLFARFPGRWKLNVFRENTPALPFWRKVIAGASEGDVSETIEPERGRTQFEFIVPEPG